MRSPERKKPLIFISHSAKDATAQQVLLKLYRALSKDFEVLLDKERLRANDDWRDELHSWMALCQGAVLLLSEDAVCRSPWVKREATFLGYRREDDDNFKLITVMLPGVTTEKLQQGDFAPLKLDAIQAIKSGSPEVIVSEVLEALEPLRERVDVRTPLQEVEQIIAGILFREVERDLKYPQPLFDAAALMGKRLKWRAGKTYSEQLARELLGASLEKTVEVVGYLAKHFGDKNKLEELLDYLKPFWVSPDAVLELPRMTKRPRRQRAVCVNGVEHPFTAECYILRACAGSTPWINVNVIPKRGYDEVGKAHMRLIEQSIIKELAYQLGFDEDAVIDDEEISDDLSDKEAQGEPFFILIPETFDEDLLEILRARFEAFTFFLLHGSSTPDERALEGRHILLLKPELLPGQDQKFHKLYRGAKSVIRRLKKRNTEEDR